MAEAKRTEKIAKAELDARYKPSNKAIYEVSVTRAKADFVVAKEKCDDSAGRVKDVCMEEAKTALVIAKFDAKVRLETSKANATAI